MLGGRRCRKLAAAACQAGSGPDELDQALHERAGVPSEGSRGRGRIPDGPARRPRRQIASASSGAAHRGRAWWRSW